MLLLLRLWPHAPLAEMVPLSTGVWSADGELLRVTLASDEQYRLWTPLREISPELTAAFLMKEDRWFRWHAGVNPVAILRAGFRTARGGRRQGGSTITMQLARLLFRQNTRTTGGKLRQISAALWLEARYSKQDLLEAYLNLAPFGRNIEGVGAATRIYFGKAPAAVTLGEALTLAVIPQRPAARTRNADPEPGFLAARARLAALWLRTHRTSESDRRQLALPVLTAPYSMPHAAPHFVDAMLSGEARGTAVRLDTTLDSRLQRLAEGQIERYISQFGDRGIRNVATLLVDTRDMSVKSWVGSADYGNEAIHGQINGVTTKRSPGSALKPLIYALALDQGVLHPQTVLRDAPTAFGPFTPENFDGRFFGPVTTEQALIRSRNVPAVWVASQLKQPSLYQFLRNAGVSRMKPEPYYGLALALGGGEVTMEELAGLYAMLANHGVLKPLRTKVNVPTSEGVPLLSPEASFITLDMLSRNRRPDENDGALVARSNWPVAWKTGTSWGFRDAWSAGVVGNYVLVVWIGDFEAQGNPSFVGVEAAAPLFFRIADALQLARPGEAVVPRIPPSGVSQVAVCAGSGDLPDRNCPHTVKTWFIPGKSPIRVSQLHRMVAVDRATGLAVCPPYSDQATRFELYEFWPSDMLKLFREAGVPRRKPPAIPDCAADNLTDGPRINSPLRSVTYALRGPGGDSIGLEASAASDVRSLFWFDGKDLLGKAEPGQGPLVWRRPAEGLHLIRVVDDRGRSAERDVLVKLAN